MELNYNFLKTKGLMNIHSDAVVCYDRENDYLNLVTDEMRYDDDFDESRYVELPELELYEGVARKLFWKRLNKEQMALVADYIERRGFSDFLRETHLSYAYKKALDAMVPVVLSNWEEENDISVDWEIAGL